MSMNQTSQNIINSNSESPENNADIVSTDNVKFNVRSSFHLNQTS